MTPTQLRAFACGGPTGVGQGRGRRARGQRGRGLDARRAAAQGVRRHPVHPHRLGPGVHAGRPAAGQPGGRDPRPAGPDRPRGQPGRARPAGAPDRGHPPLRRARGTRADRAVRGPRRRPRGRAQRAPGRRSSPALLASRTVDVAIGPAASTPAGRAGPAPVPEVRGARRGRAPTTRSPAGSPLPTRCAARPGTSGPSAVEHRRRGAAHARRPRHPRGATSGSSRATRRRWRRPSAARGSRSAVRFAVAGDLAAGRLVVRRGAAACAPRAAGPRWPCPRTARPRRPPSCSASSPPRGRPRRWCAAPACTCGRFRPAVHVTLWS